MQTVALTWQQAGGAAVLLSAFGIGMSFSGRTWLSAAGAFLREAAMLAGLYGLWQLAGTLSTAGAGGAFRRARWIEHIEHDLRFPSERTVQSLILGHKLLSEAANLYYAVMDFPTMFAFLIWLFVRHREQYRSVRQVLAWSTLGCLVIQLVPVAPPRMLPGIVDLGRIYNQSVYGNGLGVDQLSAMPSVHVAWAVFVGYYAWRVSSSRWRYLGIVHGGLTVFVVLATGNHWWLDCIVGSSVVALSAWSVVGAHALIRRTRSRTTLSRVTPADAAPTSGPIEMSSRQ